jgi:hypothetical protein
VRALHGLGNVGDHAVERATHLVAEEPKPTGATKSDRARRDAPGIGSRGGDFDDEPPIRHPYLERGVVERTSRPPLEAGDDRLVDAPVQTNRVAAGAEREPVEVDGAHSYLSASAG